MFCADPQLYSSNSVYLAHETKILPSRNCDMFFLYSNDFFNFQLHLSFKLIAQVNSLHNVSSFKIFSISSRTNCILVLCKLLRAKVTNQIGLQIKLMCQSALMYYFRWRTCWVFVYEGIKETKDDPCFVALEEKREHLGREMWKFREEDGGWGSSRRNGVMTDYERDLSNQRETSVALNSAGLEVGKSSFSFSFHQL